MTPIWSSTGTSACTDKEARTSPSALSDHCETTRSMPSSLLTDEDWDQLLLKEQKRQLQEVPHDAGERNGHSTSGNPAQSSILHTFSSESPSLNVCKEQNVREADSAGAVMLPPSLATKKITETGEHSTPTSPSELLRMTTRSSSGNHILMEEAKQFEKDLGDWVREGTQTGINTLDADCSSCSPQINRDCSPFEKPLEPSR
jgi:hypothetical protein